MAATAAVDLALLAIPAAIGVAILRYRLYDIDRLINRTLVYGLLTALLAGVYTGAVLVLGQLFGGVGRDPASWAVAGATLAVAALFQPARRRIQQAVDRRFNRRKYNTAKSSPPSTWPCRDRMPRRDSDLPALGDCALTVSEVTDISPSIRRRHTSGVGGEPSAPVIGSSSAKRRLG